MADQNENSRLNSKWCFWYDDFNPSREMKKSDPYDKNLYLISTFDTIEVLHCFIILFLIFF